MSRVDIAAQVTAALTQLGDTPDQVADELYAKEIKGFRGCPGSCPVARFVCTLDGVAYAEVTEESAWLMPDEGETACRVTLPGPVTEFVVNFDQGVYSDLVAPVVPS